MPRYKRIDTGMKFLPIDLSVQLLPGTFEHALSHLVDHELDLRVLGERFKNAESGAPAYAPSVLLKVVLYYKISLQRKPGKHQLSRGTQRKNNLLRNCGTHQKGERGEQSNCLKY